MERYTGIAPLNADILFYPKGILTNPPVAAKVTQGLPGGAVKLVLFREGYQGVDVGMAYHITDPMIKDGLGLPSDRVKKNGTWEFCEWHMHFKEQTQPKVEEAKPENEGKDLVKVGQKQTTKG